MQAIHNAVAGLQILFVAFGAMVLVPLLTGLNPSMALLGAGIGTILFQIVTGWKVPIFLGSSFAFIAPIIFSMSTWGAGATFFGLFAAGFMYFVFAFAIRIKGIDSVHKLIPPVVIGPVIMVIGLSVAAVATEMAMGKSNGEQVVDYNLSIIVSTITFAVTVLVTIFGKRFLRLVPILIGIAVGYSIAASLGLVEFEKVIAAPWFKVPQFVALK